MLNVTDTLNSIPVAVPLTAPTSLILIKPSKLASTNGMGTDVLTKYQVAPVQQ